MSEGNRSKLNVKHLEHLKIGQSTACEPAGEEVFIAKKHPYTAKLAIQATKPYVDCGNIFMKICG